MKRRQTAAKKEKIKHFAVGGVDYVVELYNKVICTYDVPNRLLPFSIDFN